MGPTPQDLTPEAMDQANQLSDDRIVISGMSGLYPGCGSVKDLEKILYEKKNPIVKTNRWGHDYAEVSEYEGTIPKCQYFDAQFFRVHYYFAMTMDPMGRKILEQAFQAVYDAGVNPEELNGRRVGVYAGACMSETEKVCFYNLMSYRGLGMVGCNKSTLANRVSYALNLKGPSMAVDAACGSSHVALELACQDIASGKCEAAIVGGASLCLHPQMQIHFSRMTPMAMDGKTKSFDKNADGTVRTEAVNMLFIQKAKDARRIYAYIVGVKNEYRGLTIGDTGPRYGFLRDATDMTEFIQKFYKEINVPPQAIEYVEACGSADPDADKAELEAFEKVFCKNREKPLLVGSVASNLGYSEAAQGVSSITKVLLGYHTGKLAASINCKNPRDDLPALKNGSISIVNDHKPFERTYTAINGLSLAGLNTHIVLHGHYKPKIPERYNTSLPRLVTISSRQDSYVKRILNNLKSRPIDPEELALLHKIHSQSLFGYMGRGFTILDTNEEGETVSLSEEVTYFDEGKKPLWFAYSGMGSQWPGMGAQLMRIPVFAAAIERCHKVLQPKGIDIVHIITTKDKEIFKNILHSFVGITAIQIGLTDVLKAVGIVPDMIIGHSAGELGCAYADGCHSAEETILSAYSRGLVSVQTPFIRGSMAAVGIGFEELSTMVPPEIEVACHNGPDSSTISGPAEKMKEFVTQLTERKIFAKEVPCSNIAYHSRYVAEAGPGLLKHLREVIKDPKPRSERWVSTSVPQCRWDEPLAKYSSAEYHTNNLLSPVLFEETSRLIPDNAVVVEIAPHGLLQAILKRSLPASCKNIALTRRDHVDNTILVLEAIGKLYLEGYDPKIDELYPKVEFPVSTGTPMLSHLVEWVHTEKWMLPVYNSAKRKAAASCNYYVSLHENEYKNLSGNIINGKILYPFSAALVAVWDTLSMVLEKPRRELSVEFNEIRLYAEPVIVKQKPLKIYVTLTKGNRRFEVLNENSTIATGYIEVLDSDIYDRSICKTEEREELNISSDAIYRVFHERDFNYTDDFRSLLRTNSSLTEAKIIWNDDWITFLDGALQLLNLRENYSHISQPYEIRRIRIDTKLQKEMNEIFGDREVRTANVCTLSSAVRCGGLLVEDVKLKNLPFAQKDTIMLKPKINSSVKVAKADKTNLGQGTTLQMKNLGDFDSLKWVTTAKSCKPGIEVKVAYAAVNDIDVKRATGVIPFKTEAEISFGMDFSGVTASGQRVMGILQSGSLSETVKAIPEATWPVPEYWSLEDAATVPSAYMLAFYCLAIKCDLIPNMRILVHGGAGALGQAVISIALAHKLEVFTTVSDIRKKRFLLKLFPELKEDHIGNSRDVSFGDMIMSSTKGEGVEIIISCVKNEFKKISLDRGAKNSILFDLIQIPTKEDFSFGMFCLFKCRNYMSIDLSSIFAEENRDELKSLQGLLYAGIKAEYVRPLSRITYAPEDVPRAFRLLAASHHRGRVLIKIADADTSKEIRLTCDAEKTQVIVCFDDSVGVQQWIDRLISRGAKNFLLHSNLDSAYLQLKSKLWQKLRVNIKISSNDLYKTEEVKTFLNESKQYGPLEGIYIIETNRKSKVEYVTKVVQNLDVVVRSINPSVRYFSIISAVGNIGEDTCISRMKSGLPATFVDISGDNKTDVNAIDQHIDIKPHEMFDAFERATISSHPSFVATSQGFRKQTLVEEVFHIAEINLTKSTKSSTLIDLGIKPEKIPLIKSYLSDNYHVSLKEEFIATLSVEKIQEIEESMSEPNYEEARGLGIFYSSINDDELQATAESIFMPTLVNSASERDFQFDITQTYMCVVPGLEGQYDRFSDFCQLLKVPAIVLQPGLDRIKETMAERAQRFAKTLLKKTKIINNKFYILGYETGILVALEMAAILEKQGFTGTVFCLGGTPEEILALLEKQTAQYKPKELQTEVARHITSLVTVKDIDLSSIEEAKEGESWLAPWTKALRDQVSLSFQYTRALIEGAYEMITATRAYVPHPNRLRSRVVLIRASDVELGTDPQKLIQRYSQQPVEVVTLPTPLAHLLKDLRGPAIVNNNLEPALRESYKCKNLCETYLDNHAIFIA